MTARKLKRLVTGGFTLVELLIVIALLGAIALIVIAAINPIEQANRARDTRFKADGAQLISAIDRYFAVSENFTWVDAGLALNNDATYGFITATDEGIGICGTDCTVEGLLLSTDELKSEFKNRDFITTTVAADMLYIGKASETSASVYSCFIPSSNAIRDKACNESRVYTLSALDGSRTDVPTVTCSGAPGTDWSANLWTVCVPE